MLISDLALIRKCHFYHTSSSNFQSSREKRTHSFILSESNSLNFLRLLLDMLVSDLALIRKYHFYHTSLNAALKH